MMGKAMSPNILLPLLPFLVVLLRPSAAQRHRPQPSLRGPQPPSARLTTHAPMLPPSSPNGVGSGENCGNVGHFQLDLQISRDSCETSWVLERSVTDDTPHMVYVDGYHRSYAVDDFDSHSPSFSRNICLTEGEYRFTIYDAFGDGIAAPGHYMLALDGVVLAGSSNFGYEEVTTFTVASRSPTLALDYSDYSGGGLSMDDYDLDATFSTYVPERLSGIIDLSLVSTNQNHHEQDDFLEDFKLEDGPNSTIPRANWTELLSDDFEEGLGIFRAWHNRVTYYPFVRGRRGVVRLQNEHRGDGTFRSASVRTGGVAVPPDVTLLRLVFSFYANDNELHDGFCLDYGVDDDGGLSTEWRSKKCWHAVEDFENGHWYDNASVVFHLRKDRGARPPRSFRIRFRAKTDSLHDDVLIDRVKLMGAAN